ncbi:sugar phosphate isomerase/epimerase family protein [Brachybacterium hainanense]|uniref:Sugar phosphate isomerase/epimerase family protein n=1 Tax=Brachybacterium hainanense TaxID=1541174 RepID=A0ABV6R6R0_9MICO
MAHGVIAPIDQQRLALAAGADYLESTVVGTLVAPSPTEGAWEPVRLAPSPARPVPSFAILIPGDLRVADPSVPMGRIRAYARTALDAVAAVAGHGAKIVLGSGAARTIGPDVPASEGAARFAEVLILFRDEARARGLEIVLEPLHRGETDLIHTVGEAAQFLDAHGIEGVRIVADLFHIQLEAEPLAQVELLAGRVGHAHIADTDRVPPGQGDWPLGEFLAALRRGGYTGDVTLECRWEDLAAELPDALAAVRAADPAHRS